MAIEVMIGNVGSGKTYYATWKIWQEIKKIYNAEINGTKYKYTHILTNIEGFTENKYVKQLKIEDLIKLYEEELKKYKEWETGNKNIDFSGVQFKAEDVKIDVNRAEEELIVRIPNYVDNVKKFDTLNERILDYIKIGNQREIAYIEHTKPIFQKAGFSDCLIVIDEAHNYFSRLSAAKERLISYHRHYDQDYFLITQDLKQLSNKVTGIAQKTIKAGNPVTKSGKSFVYKVYSGGYISFRDTNLLEKIRLKADEHIFKLYNSGSVKKQNTYFYKVLFKWGSPLLFVMVGFYFFLQHIKKDGIESPPHNPSVHKVHKKAPPPKKKKEKIKYSIIKVTRIGNFYLYKDNKYPASTFMNALEQCNAMLNGIHKNLDSTVVEVYRIKDLKCLDTALLSASFF